MALGWSLESLTIKFSVCKFSVCVKHCTCCHPALAIAATMLLALSVTAQTTFSAIPQLFTTLFNSLTMLSAVWLLLDLNVSRTWVSRTFSGMKSRYLWLWPSELNGRFPFMWLPYLFILCREDYSHNCTPTWHLILWVQCPYRFFWNNCPLQLKMVGGQ